MRIRKKGLDRRKKLLLGDQPSQFAWDCGGSQDIGLSVVKSEESWEVGHPVTATHIVDFSMQT